MSKYTKPQLYKTLEKHISSILPEGDGCETTLDEVAVLLRSHKFIKLREEDSYTIWIKAHTRSKVIKSNLDKKVNDYVCVLLYDTFCVIGILGKKDGLWEAGGNFNFCEAIEYLSILNAGDK